MEYKDYLRPESLEDVLHVLRDIQGRALIFAGGTDILVNARQDDRYAGHTIVDIYGLPG